MNGWAWAGGRVGGYHAVAMTAAAAMIAAAAMTTAAAAAAAGPVRGRKHEIAVGVEVFLGSCGTAEACLRPAAAAGAGK